MIWPCALQKSRNPPDSPQQFLRRQEHQRIVAKETQGFMDSGKRYDAMSLQLVGGPENTMNFDSVAFRYAPQGSITCQQDGLLNLFGKCQGKAVIEFEP